MRVHYARRCIAKCNSGTSVTTCARKNIHPTRRTKKKINSLATIKPRREFPYERYVIELHNSIASAQTFFHRKRRGNEKHAKARHRRKLNVTAKYFKKYTKVYKSIDNSKKYGNFV